MRQRKLWGWGYDGEGVEPAEREALTAALKSRFPDHEPQDAQPPRREDLNLPEPRVSLPSVLAGLGSSELVERATHAYGKSYRDLVRSLRGLFGHPPDVVARPRNESDVTALLEWCADAKVAAIPYGGGTSVVGGVEPVVGDSYSGTVSIDLGRLDRVLEIDSVSGLARIQGGTLGPSLEEQLQPHGLTLRHYPQSFELSTLGGWIATRSAGHHAILHTHVDDLVASVRTITPAGVFQTRRLPASGAGPAPERLIIGSEGAFGIVTEAWMRVRERPRFREGAAATFESFDRGVAAARALARSDLYPATCRLLDQTEALLAGAGDGVRSVLLISFESHDHALGPWVDRAVELSSDYGGESSPGRSRGSPAEAWRRAFLRAPHLRDEMIRIGFTVETFETAVVWSGLSQLIESVREGVEAAAPEAMLMVRLTHAYPDGAAPYFTVIAPAPPGAEVERWDEIKAAASDAILARGGTITHHHAVGRDHRAWYDQERPEPYAEALRAAKQALDPSWILNPGVLLDPPDGS
ncbi:MAG TPA: FAD-binding oxidoreductase [Actinomycetota bacterium]|nr:FAD-binding oxidoreductase [Actinomycetota bacterium]